jgi:hypothetical protein
VRLGEDRGCLGIVDSNDGGVPMRIEGVLQRRWARVRIELVYSDDWGPG